MYKNLHEYLYNAEEGASVGAYISDGHSHYIMYFLFIEVALSESLKLSLAPPTTCPSQGNHLNYAATVAKVLIL